MANNSSTVRPRVVGLVGGVAAGKSFVAQVLSTLGAAVISADALGHEVLKDKDVQQALVRRWGPAILDAAGQVDRGAVAKQVFAPPPDGPRELRFLEGIVHPRIHARLQAQRDTWLQHPSPPLVVLDAALLFEASWHSLCDYVIYVDAPESVRHRRARDRGWSAAEVAAREAAQLPLDAKRARADFILDAGGTCAQTRLLVESWWRNHMTDG